MLISVNMCLLCATNRDLDTMVRKELFREDLLYRINTIHLHIPPLRERTDDIAPLAHILLRKQAQLYGKPELILTPAACDKLKAQPWYGNIRELEHAIEKAVIISDGKMLDAEDFDFPSAAPPSESPPNDKIEEHTSELQSPGHLVCRLLLEKKKHQH